MTDDHVARLMARPDILAAVRYADEHPEEAVELDLPPAPDGLELPTG